MLFITSQDHTLSLDENTPSHNRVVTEWQQEWGEEEGCHYTVCPLEGAFIFSFQFIQLCFKWSFLLVTNTLKAQLYFNVKFKETIDLFICLFIDARKLKDKVSLKYKCCEWNFCLCCPRSCKIAFLFIYLFVCLFMFLFSVFVCL